MRMTTLEMKQHLYYIRYRFKIKPIIYKIITQYITSILKQFKYNYKMIEYTLKND